MDANKEEDEQSGFRLEVRIVGPIKRSTLEEKHPDREWETTNDVRYWSYCTLAQAGRLVRSFAAEMPWNSSGRRIVMERRFSETSYDEHCLVVAATNLDRALRRAHRKLRQTAITDVTRRALQLLRNVYEHWDELRASYRQGNAKQGAALKLSQEFPGVEPWSLVFNPDDGDVAIAGLISLRSLVKDLRTLEARTLWELRRLRRLGRHVAQESPNQRLQRTRTARR
jgi:hypothetical protein